jgi:hypothetical protein
MNPFLPDLDPELEPEPAVMRLASDMKGYDIGDPSPISAGKHGEDDDEDDDEAMAGSALFPGSDIF